jgi:hypothetical protein
MIGNSKHFFVAVVCLSLAGAFSLKSQDRARTILTIYSDNLGIVRDARTFSLQKGMNEIKLTDLPAQLDPTSVRLESTGSGKISIAEQNFLYDLVSDAKLLEKYLDKQIKITTRDGIVLSGFLLSGIKKEVVDSSMYRLGREPTFFNPTNQPVIDYSYVNLVLSKDRQKGPFTIVQRENNIREIELPMTSEDLIVSPMLRFKAIAEESGPHPCQISYQTRGLGWRVDYILVLTDNEKTADVNGWATISNTSGADFREAEIRLMAQDIRPNRFGRGQRVYKYGNPDPEIIRESTANLPIADNHLYPLKDRTTLANNETKQVQLLASEKLTASKFYIYDGAQISEGYGEARREALDAAFGTQSTNKVGIYLELLNKGDGLGQPLPRGKFRVYKRDRDGNPEMIGEDAIDHTPPGEQIHLRLGHDFDLSGSRRQTEFKVVTPSSPTYGGGVFDESIEVSVSNHKTETTEIRIVEHLYRWTDWEILQSTQNFTKLDAQTIEFRVPLNAGEEKRVSYKVRYKL